jgi:hypothetical protein
MSRGLGMGLIALDFRVCDKNTISNTDPVSSIFQEIELGPSPYISEILLKNPGNRKVCLLLHPTGYRLTSAPLALDILESCPKVGLSSPVNSRAQSL